MRILSFILLIVSFLSSEAQIVKKKNSISANYGVSYSVYATDAVGSASIDGFAHNVGIHYNRYFSMNLSFETGLRYTQHHLEVSGINGIGQPFNYDDQSSFIHLPLLVEYGFLNYLFAQLGPTVSIQLSKDDNNQSGIGIWGAFGAKIPLKNYELKLYPYYQSQSIVSFSAENNYYSLQNVGFNVGLSYRF